MDRSSKEVSSVELDWSNSNEAMDSRPASRFLFRSMRSNTEFVDLASFSDYDHTSLSPLAFPNDHIDVSPLSNECQPNPNNSDDVATVEEVIAAAAAASELGLTMKLEDGTFNTTSDPLDPGGLLTKPLTPEDLVNDINEIETQNVLLPNEDLQVNLMNSASMDKAFSLLGAQCSDLLPNGLLPATMSSRIEHDTQISDLEQPVVQLPGGWSQEDLQPAPPPPQTLAPPPPQPMTQIPSTLPPASRVQLMIATPDGSTMAYSLDGAFPSEQLGLLASALKQELLTHLASLVLNDASLPETGPPETPSHPEEEPPLTPPHPGEEPPPPLPELPLDTAATLEDMNPTLNVDVGVGVTAPVSNELLLLPLDNAADYTNFLSENDTKINENVETFPLVKNRRSKRLIQEQENKQVVATNDFKAHDIEETDLTDIQRITDKAVPARAWATLPISYLAINKLSSSTNGYGVFARRSIPKRTQFGPLEGAKITITDPLNLIDNSSELKLIVEEDTGQLFHVDISDENASNWMRFVRPAKSAREQNVTLTQQGRSLYFITTRPIYPRQELKVWYSGTYATRRGLQMLSLPSPNDKAQDMWPCFECNEKYPTSMDLQKHLNVHDAERGEDEAKSRRKSGRFLKKNKKFKSEKQCRYQCHICSRYFPRNYSLKRHLIIHNNSEARTSCEICNIKFPHIYSKNKHMKKYHPNIINTKTQNLSSNTLRIQDTKIMQNTSTQVSNELENASCLSTPMTSTTNLIQRQNKNRNNANPAKPHKCRQCYKTFTSEDRLQKHMMVHGEEELKPFQCLVCMKRFLNNSALSCHVKVHTDKQSYQCPLCNKTYDQILKLREHIPEHCVNGRYPCNQCNRKFDEYSAVRKHIRSFHSDRKHSCTYCSKLFPSVDKLRKHMLRHSDHREFLCADCGKQFKRKDKLIEHMRRLHSAEKEAALKNNNNSINNNNNIKTPVYTVTSQVAPPDLNSALNNNNNISQKRTRSQINPHEYQRYIYKCHLCVLGFKRRGMLVNHLANRHPNIKPESVPELNLPILKTTRDYYCQYCEKVYKSSSKRKAHILKNHPGAELPLSNRVKGGGDMSNMPNPSYSQPAGSVTSSAHGCAWCHKQYASKAKLLQHQRNKHQDLLPSDQQVPRMARVNQPEPELNSLIFPQTINFFPGELSMGEQVLDLGSTGLLIDAATLSALSGTPPEDLFRVVAELGRSFYNPR